MFRYISRGTTEAPGDLTNSELTDLTKAGWAVGVVQHAAASGTVVGTTIGTTWGTQAAERAQGIGVPAGACIFVDVEGYASNSDLVGFCQAWALALTEKAPEYSPGLYYAYPGLTKDQVEELIGVGTFMAYWAGGDKGTPRGIGETINQSLTTTMSATCNGIAYTISVDPDLLLSGQTVPFIIA